MSDFSSNVLTSVMSNFECACYVAEGVGPAFCSCVSSVLLALRLPRLGKRELILVLFVRLFDLYFF